MVKFDDKNNFGMWRCEVIDALTASNLKDTLRLKKKRELITEEDWDKRIERRVVVQVLFDTRYHVLHETSARQL